MPRRRFTLPRPAAPLARQWRARFDDDTDLVAVKVIMIVLVSAAAAALEVLP